MKPLIEGMQAYYAKRGIFQGRFGFGERPAVIVIDFAYKCVKGCARLPAMLLNYSSLRHKLVLLIKHPRCNTWGQLDGRELCRWDEQNG